MPFFHPCLPSIPRERDKGAACILGGFLEGSKFSGLYLYTTGYFKRQVILKQQFTIEKGYYVNDSTKKFCSTPYLLSRIALRLLSL
jgi:hypothetical protein